MTYPIGLLRHIPLPLTGIFRVPDLINQGVFVLSIFAAALGVKLVGRAIHGSW